jgi:8-oxo-dGTP diphosphatase
MGVLVVRGGRVLLGRRRGKHGAGQYSAPGGHVEWGESLAETARREVREETGLEIENIRLLSLGSYCWGDRHYVDIDVVAEAPSGEPQLREPDRCEGWDWYDLDDLPKPLFAVTATMIRAYRTGQVLALLDEVVKE